MEKLFGTSGIRGTFNTQFTPLMALKLGSSLGTYITPKSVVVGRDTRTTAETIECAITSGLLSTGCKVYRTGIVTTPTLAYITKHLNVSSGIMITASHNPPPAIGIKLWNPDGMGFTSEQENEIERIYSEQAFSLKPWHLLGKIERMETADSVHIDMIRASVDFKIIRKRHFKLVVDPGCGAAYKIAPRLLRELGCTVASLNAQRDGFFPGRDPVPSVENLANLSALVDAVSADLGVAFDGDADRVVFTDERGRVIEGDRFLAALAKREIENGGNGKTVTTMDASMVIEEVVNKAGGEVFRTPVGDIQVAVKIKQCKGMLGGEACGTFIWPEAHYGPDSLLTIGKLLEFVAHDGIKISEFVSSIPKYPILREKIECPDKLKQVLMDKLEMESSSLFEDITEIQKVDGLRLVMSKGWILIRPSGTESIIRLTAEGKNIDIANDYLRKLDIRVSELIESLRKSNRE
ncbi:MAG: phosphoglucosamine mutase [Candidatus Hodarchaeota archaeon]